VQYHALSAIDCTDTTVYCVIGKLPPISTGVLLVSLTSTVIFVCLTSVW